MSTANRKKPTRPRPPARSRRSAPAAPAVRLPAERLLGDLRGLIEQARAQVAWAVNAGLVGLYWQIGRRIRQDILHEQRAEYGEQIVSSLSRQLTAEYGRGFDRRNLFHMIRFAELFPDE